MNHIVLFSGGIGSWATALRVKESMAEGDVLWLVFTDTKTEDEDLYRFLIDAATDIGTGKLVWLADGRDVWQVFNDENFIGNTRVDICSRILKRDLSRRWIETNFSPEDTTVYLGIDWTEIHRYERAVPHWEPWPLKAPMTEKPYLDKEEMLALAESRGLVPPRLYSMGFAHNNCGGFCVKQGQGGFKQLLIKMPERYAYHEQKEEEFRERTGKDVAILRDRRGGTTKPLTLKALRERIEADDTEGLTLDEIGGCGCMIDFNEGGQDWVGPEPSVTIIELGEAA